MLDGFEDAELKAIISRADDLLKKHDTERKEKALAEARATLAAVGLSLKDIGKAKAKAGKSIPYHGGHVYQHPTDKTLVWAAKGKKPGWLLTLEGEGKAPLEVANDNSAVRKTG